MKELSRNATSVWIEDGLGDYMVVLGPRGGALLCTGCEHNRTRCRHIRFVRRRRKGE